jgi:hypothetical protein
MGEMKIRYIVGAAVIAMFVIPGSASEFAAIGAQHTASYAASASHLFNDPNAEPTLSITLPAKFVAVDTQFDPTQHFNS